ncbi:MAG TPA: response regulator [Thermoanaerobaculia bacterium]
MPGDLILVVEDDLAVRRGLSDALRWAGFEALEAGDGDLGQRLALERPVRLVLLDLVLPRRQGLEVLKAIRAPLGRSRRPRRGSGRTRPAPWRQCHGRRRSDPAPPPPRRRPRTSRRPFRRARHAPSPGRHR